MAENEPELPRDTAAAREPDGACTFDADDMAILGGASGVASLILSLVAWARWPHFLALPLGLFAIVACWRALKLRTERKEEAQSGLYCGVIGVCVWLALSSLNALAKLLGF
ncbi:MAG: hypothetical protein HYU66_14360 [Armatimonadetes bacterium]|nr:hypothetical protein [Armatimonadota bacterium]